MGKVARREGGGITGDQGEGVRNMKDMSRMEVGGKEGRRDESELDEGERALVTPSLHDGLSIFHS